MENEENAVVAPEVVPAPVAEPSPSCDARKRLDAARQFACEQYDKLRHAASSQMDNVRHYTDNARQQLSQGWDATCTKAKDLHNTGEEFVRSNPTGSLLGALGVGVLIGLLLGRRS